MVTLLGNRPIRLPRSIGEVTAVASHSEAPAEAAGLPSRALDRIWRGVEDLYRSAAYPGISFCLRRRGQVVLHRALGHAAGNGPDDPPEAPKRLMQPDTPVCAFSASKAVTAILIHKLAEEGGLRLEDRVSAFIPQFAQHGKRSTTLAEVLAHRGGFPMFDLPKDQIHPDTLLDWDRCVELICNAPPTHSGGPRLAYHAITGGYILAEVLQRVTQRPLGAYLDEKIRQPMGMRHFTYGVPVGHRDAVALNYTAGAPVRYPISRILERALVLPVDQIVDASNSRVFYDAVIPAGNIYCTAEELSRFFQMLLDHGEYGGRQILRDATVRRAVAPACQLRFDHTLKIPMRYSEGMMLGASPFGVYGPMTARAYGHIGFMNILGWADPQREISAGLMVTGKAVLGAHLFALGQLLTTIAWQCRT